jgi:hypothetical protein
MELMACPRQNIDDNHDKAFKMLTDSLGLSHLRLELEENQITVRFANGYGVTIFQMAREEHEEVFEMLVLRSYGPGDNDYQVAQYASIPELHCGNFEEILNLCKQVVLLPPNRARGSQSKRPGYPQ